MLHRLRTPPGPLGTLSVASAVLLALVGVVGAIAMVVSLATDSGFWADDTTSLLVSLALFLVVLFGAVGFVVEDRSPGLGAALAVTGSLAFALILFWAVLPILLGVGSAVVAVLRARALGSAGHGRSVATA
jgi:hypothetical protein